MNQTEQILLQIIKKSLWNTDCIISEEIDWNAVLKEAEEQAILGIAARAVPKEIQKQWGKSITGVTRNYIRILFAEKNLVELFQQNEIPLAILKGTAASVYYPVPSSRSMGDIDCVVPKDCFDESKRLLLNNGYVFVSEHSENRHAGFSKDGISIELHYHFSYNDIDVESYIEDGMSGIELHTVDGIAFPMLPKLANGLVLLAHMMHHLKTALGLRQAIDWMMYVNSVLDDVFWDTAFKSAADQTGLTTAAVTATRMCQIYLGLSDRIEWCKDADPELCRGLMDSMLSSGNFGTKLESGASVERVSARLREEGFFSHLQKAGEKNWRAYHKHKWLKPIAWIYPACLYAKKGLRINHSGSKIIADIKRGKQRTDLYQKMINKQ